MSVFKELYHRSKVRIRAYGQLSLVFLKRGSRQAIPLPKMRHQNIAQRKAEVIKRIRGLLLGKWSEIRTPDLPVMFLVDGNLLSSDRYHTWSNVILSGSMSLQVSGLRLPVYPPPVKRALVTMGQVRSIVIMFQAYHKIILMRRMIIETTRWVSKHLQSLCTRLSWNSFLNSNWPSGRSMNGITGSSGSAFNLGKSSSSSLSSSSSSSGSWSDVYIGLPDSNGPNV